MIGIKESIEMSSPSENNIESSRKVVVKKVLRRIPRPLSKSSESEPEPKSKIEKNKTPNPTSIESDPKLTGEDAYVLQTMLTCLGNKRLLVNNIRDIADEVCKRLNKSKLRILDGFSGSAVVSRKLSYIASEIYANDLEEYAYLIARSSLETPSEAQRSIIESHITKMNEIARNGPYIKGFVSELYAPVDTENIQPGERCFYTQENAQVIDTLRKYISTDVPDSLQHHCLVPLLTKASIHANTSGVFKGFHTENGVGKWGGAAARCLPRIKGDIQLDIPVWNTDPSSQFVSEVSKKDINTAISDFAKDSLDIVYLDPPYNQHPYGSNYFMLNLIATNVAPSQSSLSAKSGIPNTWNRSNYNYKKSAMKDMSELLRVSLEKSAYVLISYNDEGIITDEDWEEIFKPYVVEKYEIKYNAYRGSRNLSGRSDKVMERMYLVHCSE